MTFLELRAVEKRLGGRDVLCGASLAIAEPSVVVVSGENGAGKSTLLRVIAGVIQSDAGDVLVAGASLDKDRREALHALGYVPEAADLPPRMTPRELGVLVAALKDVDAPGPGAAERVGAAPFLDRPLAALSLGQRRRSLLYAALVGDPPLLVLDEPTNGLDAEGMALLAALLAARPGEGRAALVATHDAAFASAVATRRVSLRGGVVSEI